MTGRERIVAVLNGRQADRLPCMPITMMFAADILGVPYKRYGLDRTVMAETQIKTADMDPQQVAQILRRAVALAVPGIVLEFELLPAMTERPEWGAEITAKKLRLSRKEQQWLTRIDGGLGALPADEAILVAEMEASYGSLYDKASYGL